MWGIVVYCLRLWVGGKKCCCSDWSLQLAQNLYRDRWEHDHTYPFLHAMTTASENTSQRYICHTHPLQNGHWPQTATDHLWPLRSRNRSRQGQGGCVMLWTPLLTSTLLWQLGLLYPQWPLKHPRESPTWTFKVTWKTCKWRWHLWVFTNLLSIICSTLAQHNIYAEDFQQITKCLPFIRQCLKSNSESSWTIQNIINKVCPMLAALCTTSLMWWRSRFSPPQTVENTMTQVQ